MDLRGPVGRYGHAFHAKPPEVLCKGVLRRFYNANVCDMRPFDPFDLFFFGSDQDELA